MDPLILERSALRDGPDDAQGTTFYILLEHFRFCHWPLAFGQKHMQEEIWSYPDWSRSIEHHVSALGDLRLLAPSLCLPSGLERVHLDFQESQLGPKALGDGDISMLIRVIARSCCHATLALYINIIPGLEVDTRSVVTPSITIIFFRC